MRRVSPLALGYPALLAAVALWVACPAGGPEQTGTRKPAPGTEGAAKDGGGLFKKAAVPPLPGEAAPAPTPRLNDTADGPTLGNRIQSYFAGHIGRRFYIQLDKPLYKPGETVWVKVWDLTARGLSGEHPAASNGLLVELHNPKGAAVATHKVREQSGIAQADFELAEGMEGGEYTLRVQSFDGQSSERPLIVSTYEPPRLKMKLEFVRKAYGAGDEVSATVEVKRTTGEPLKHHTLTGLIRLDGQDLPRVELFSNASGEGLLTFVLPPVISNGDGLLTVLAEDGGLTESIAKRIPIVVKKLMFSAFPEGGQLVEGLASRVYFEARTPLNKPADVSGRIVDDHGATLARFESVHDGLGRLEFTPSTGRTYHAEIDRPVGVSEQYPLPLAAPSGCVLRSFDDLDGELEALRVSVRCTEKRKVVVAATLRENFLDAATVQVPGNRPAVVYLTAKGSEVAALGRAQGVARVTVFDDKHHPLAERLVYRNRRARLDIRVEAHKPSYSPRDQVTLSVSTLDQKGQPLPAELALAVVDDTVLSYADDKTGHILSRLYLEPELPDKVEEPNFYFDLTEPKSALALDLLMGTRGYRRFEWGPLLNPAPPPPPVNTITEQEPGDFGGLRRPMGGAVPVPRAPVRPLPMARNKAEFPLPPQKMPAPLPAELPVDEKAVMQKKAVAAHARPMAAGPPAAQPVAAAKPMPVMVPEPMKEAKADRLADKDEEAPAVLEWAPIRVFPAPTYRGDYSGPRIDFRETIAWQPSVLTGKDGKATVTFYLSDAISSFRVVTEGVGRGLCGRDETVIKSSLPFSMAVKLPVEVSEKDKLRLPLVLTNERESPLALDLQANFGDLLSLDRPVERTSGTLAAQAREALYYPLTVAGKQGRAEVRFTASTAGLHDEFVRELRVTPLGFPQQQSISGQVEEKGAMEVDLSTAMVNTIDGALKLYPTPVATMLSGLDGMLQQPSGCFEQTSSTNYPNVMILRYLKQQGIAEPRLMERAAQLVDEGYKRLTGFETKEKGYEWFGTVPAHEALTAYGLAEFLDMKEIYNVDSEMLGRTAAWLRSRRDGKGGYLRDPKSLDSFGSASPEVTNAYITYSLIEANQTDLDKEVEAAARLASETRDAYLLALTANTLLKSGRKQAGRDAAQRLAALQDADGGFKKASHSITRSGGVNLHTETTALAVLALLRAGGFDEAVRRSVEWLTGHRDGFGAFGATQATVLALKALTAYAIASSRMSTEGEVTLSVNGQRVGMIAYESGHREPLVFGSLGQYLKTGKNRLELRSTSATPLPFSLGIEYRALTPSTSPAAKIDLSTVIERPQVKMGESVRLHVEVKNKTPQGQPMTLARVGIPGGLSFQTWQLKELRDKGLIAFYETRPREVILYLREMKPNETAKLPLDLLATVPGEYHAPASSAYLYYTDEHKTWVDGTHITIDP